MKPKITDFSQLDLSKTYADYLTWHFQERVELIKGWIYKMPASPSGRSPAPRRLHQKVEGYLHIKLWRHFKNKDYEVYLSSFDVRLIKNIGQTDKEITTVVQPEISVICDPKKLDDRGCIGALDLIIEVLSPSTIKKDNNEKFNLYQENGVREYWLVNPEGKSLQIFYLENEEYLEFDTIEEKDNIITSKILPELKFPASEVFN